jgi:fructose-1,6-bisphosphatase/inositol monophosphatase family enzyme
LIGLLHHGRPVLGAIHQPVLQQLAIGDGRTATLNGEPIRVRPCPRIEDATMLTCDPLMPARYRDGAAFDALAGRVRLYRGFGDGYAYLLLASGWVDIVIDSVMNPWDLLPLVPVVEGAGGRITDWHGQDAGRMEASSAIACAPECHAEVVRILNPTR